MDSSGQTTVLVADVSGGSKLYEAAGYAAALEVIARCIECATLQNLPAVRW